MVRRVEVVPHDPAWAQSFQAEAEVIRAILGSEVVAVHHIGSTAIPGISAKPIVDIMVEVRDIARVDAYADRFAAQGYRPMGENGIPGRRYFIKGPDEARTHHVHIFAAGNPEIERHLTFRDYMIAHPEDARAYSRLKEDLAARFPTDIDSYVAGKDAFVKEIDRRAAAWRTGAACE